MLPRLVEMRYVRGHTIHVKFSDGAEGEVDLSNELTGEVFEPLRDEALFSRARFDTELRTVVWPNGADIAPEFLRSALRVVV